MTVVISSIPSFKINKANYFPALAAAFKLVLLSNLFIALEAAFEAILLTNAGKLSFAR